MTFSPVKKWLKRWIKKYIQTATSGAGNIGAQAEKLAREHLRQQGLKYITRNYYCRRGEVDLIMGEGSTLVFVEVRYRKQSNYGSALESVIAAKQQKIRLCAQHYMVSKKIPDTQAIRFDVVGISQGEITWLKNAF